MLALFLRQGPQEIQVGRVTAIYWPGRETLASALAEYADGAHDWPGLPPAPNRRIRIIVADSKRRFDSLTAGNLPRWGAGAAFPAGHTILVRADADPLRVVRHELAHLALHDMVRRVPLWLDEGYAARAAGEWDRLDALLVNWRLLAGGVPTLDDVTRDLRRGPQTAEAAYAFATTAVLYLERLGGQRGLMPLLSNLAASGDLDSALRTTYGLSLEQFETKWRAELRSRYGWLLLFASFATLWLAVLLVVGTMWGLRRRRNRARREALNEGWVVPVEEEGPSA